jgi:hypothetical protein
MLLLFSQTWDNTPMFKKAIIIIAIGFLPSLAYAEELGPVVDPGQTQQPTNEGLNSLQPVGQGLQSPSQESIQQPSSEQLQPAGDRQQVADFLQGNSAKLDDVEPTGLPEESLLPPLWVVPLLFVIGFVASYFYDRYKKHQPKPVAAIAFEAPLEAKPAKAKAVKKKPKKSTRPKR